MPLGEESTKLVGNIRWMHVLDISQQEVTYKEGGTPQSVYRLDYVAPNRDDTWHLDFPPKKQTRSKWGIFLASVEKAGLTVTNGPNFIGGKYVRVEEVPVDWGGDIGTKNMPVVAETYENEAAWLTAFNESRNKEEGTAEPGSDPLLEEAYTLYVQIKGNETMFRGIWQELHKTGDAEKDKETLNGVWKYVEARAGQEE